MMVMYMGILILWVFFVVFLIKIWVFVMFSLLIVNIMNFFFSELVVN